MVLWIRHLQHEQLKKQANKSKQVGLHSSVSKEFACNAGDPGSIFGSGRSPGEGDEYPHQYSCLENSIHRGAWGATVHGVAKSQTRLSD